MPLDLSRDMYTLQFEAFLHAVRTGDPSQLRNPYQGAAKVHSARAAVLGNTQC